jgi:hypothetical protein
MNISFSISISSHHREQLQLHQSYMSLKHFDFCRYVSDYTLLYSIGQTKQESIPMLLQKKVADLKSHQDKFAVQT